MAVLTIYRMKESQSGYELCKEVYVIVNLYELT